MNRRILSRITKRLSARRIAAKRMGKGSEAAKLRKRVEIIRGLAS